MTVQDSDVTITDEGFEEFTIDAILKMVTEPDETTLARMDRIVASKEHTPTQKVAEIYFLNPDVYTTLDAIFVKRNPQYTRNERNLIRLAKDYLAELDQDKIQPKSREDKLYTALSDLVDLEKDIALSKLVSRSYDEEGKLHETAPFYEDKISVASIERSRLRLMDEVRLFYGEIIERDEYELNETEADALSKARVYSHDPSLNGDREKFTKALDAWETLKKERKSLNGQYVPRKRKIMEGLGANIGHATTEDAILERAKYLKDHSPACVPEIRMNQNDFERSVIIQTLDQLGELEKQDPGNNQDYKTLKAEYLGKLDNTCFKMQDRAVNN